MILDLYDVLDVVHSGGMGVVHRVRHRSWNVDLAVKTPRPELVASAGGRRRFEAEAGTWVGLGLHPHTVNCSYVRTVDGLPRVFAEWVDGGSLAEAVTDGRLYAGGPVIALRRILDIAVQIAWGLDHAHAAEVPVQLPDRTVTVRHGLVHRDIKPQNLLLTGDRERMTLKIADFGLAKAFDSAGLSGHTLTGAMGASPAFMPRGQVIDFKYARPEADLWAVMACLYWMLTGSAHVTSRPAPTRSPSSCASRRCRYVTDCPPCPGGSPS
ncbi:serine/threonine-protein kinase [Streptomyces atratus]|uniref:serine/threonine-protein kinase n=1 Tax=Streptomyces atratus TaxID=1893 RepID=UPI0036526A15